VALVPPTRFVSVDNRNTTIVTGNSGGRSSNAGSRGSSGKKRPISPEQVLKMFAAPNYNAAAASSSGPYHAAGAAAKSQSPSPHGSSNVPQSHNAPSAVHNDNLTVRTISMSRPNVTSGSPSGQGFGICVKGGADESSKLNVSVERFPIVSVVS